jgi:OHCU decarboxylase
MDLNAVSSERASQLLGACCGCQRWVTRMIEARPFESKDAVLAEADRIWNALPRRDWLEAFMHHPRIGETNAAAAQDSRAQGWSAGEQAGVATAVDETRAALARVNRAYEQRFGFIYIVCASGKSADEMLNLARERLENDPETELRVAAEEQRKITRLRLSRLLDSPEDS